VINHKNIIYCNDNNYVVSLYYYIILYIYYNVIPYPVAKFMEVFMSSSSYDSSISKYLNWILLVRNNRTFRRANLLSFSREKIKDRA